MALASLFLETAFSFNGSNILLDDVIKRAKEEGYDRLVLTDKKMHGVYKFYQKCLKQNIKPIIGLQLKLEPILNGTFISVICYAQNQYGYKNLLKLASLQSFNDTLPIAMYAKYQDNLSTLLIPHEGELTQALTNQENYKLLINELNQMISTLYIANHPKYPLPNTPIVKSLPLDYVLYLDKEDSDVYKAIQNVFNIKETPNFVNHIEGHFKSQNVFSGYSKKEQDMLDEFLNTHELKLKIPPPKLPTYLHTQNLTSQQFLNRLSHKGLEKRLSDKHVDTSAYESRLAYELEVIHSLGYDDYFLIVWDVVKYAKKAGYLVGPGRGSAPGSLVAYVLGITDVDPIQFDLLFERFLNKDRLSMPDIDIDFPDHAREDIILYAQKTFKPENVSYICTFGTFLTKSALRETARQFEIETKYINEIAKYSTKYDSINAMISNDLDVKNRMERHEHIKKWLYIASRIEGIPKHVGTHAAGIIISHKPIIEYSAIQEGLQGGYQTQYEQSDLEAIGLLKMDFLGLRNLSMIETIVKDIEAKEHKKLNMYKIPIDDEKTFALLREKSTTGIFQLESRGMRQLIKNMQIKTFEDIAVILALFRPGPMESIPTYLNRRHKKEPVRFVSETVKPILSKTEGILLYQEQIMAIASKFANYTMSEADLLRRAVSKKDEDIMQKERKRFVEKSIQAGHEKQLANDIYDYIVKFANYGFNKSHSIAYALISYWMAYLKANYPAYFIGVLMQSALSNPTLMREYIQEAMQLDLSVHKPDVNVSENRFIKKDSSLYYPLTGIKNIGKTVYQGIKNIRDDHPFESFVDFIARTHQHVNKRSYQYLIYAGACDGFGINKHTMLENVEAIEHFVDYQGDIGLDEFVYSQYDECDKEVIKRYEIEALGFNLSFDPLKPYKQLIKDKQYKLVTDVRKSPFNKTVYLIAYVSHIHEIKTKNNDYMAFLTLEDKMSHIDAVCFPRTYEKSKSIIENGTVFLFKGKVNLKENNRQFIIDEVIKI